MSNSLKFKTIVKDGQRSFCPPASMASIPIVNHSLQSPMRFPSFSTQIEANVSVFFFSPPPYIALHPVPNSEIVTSQYFLEILVY